MTLLMETASLAGLTDPVVSKGVMPRDYQNLTSPATSFDYATAKLTSRFRLRIETARVICTLSGLGGAS